MNDKYIFFQKKKNYLKRTDFINSVDSNKIWLESMSLDEIRLLLEYLKNEIFKYKFDIDKNFIMNSRRKVLKSNIEERLVVKNKGNTNDFILELVFNFWEFVVMNILEILFQFREVQV